MTPRRRTVELVRARMLSPSVRSLVFRFVDGEPFSFAAGQYVDLFAPTESGMVWKRPYSIASAPDPSTAEIELAVTRVEEGPLSTALHAMPIGARAEVLGPRGVFTRRGGEGEVVVFIGAGTGLAPLRAMLSELLAAERSGPPVALLFGCRTEADILWGDQLRSWAAEYPRFRLEVTLSRADAAWAGRRGHVQAHVAAVVARELPRLGVSAYVCGLARMVDDVVAILENDLALPHDRVHYETFD